MPDAPDKIPLKWEEYWDFWKKAQDALGRRIQRSTASSSASGMTESSRGSDTIYNFEMALLSFGVSSSTATARSSPTSRRTAGRSSRPWPGSARCTTRATSPDAINWADGDNNANFHSKSIVMTPNPSLSIPAHWFFNGPEQYFNNMATVEWPDNPGGGKASYMVAVKRSSSQGRQGARPRQGVHPLRARAEPLLEYIKGANGRWFPAFTDVAKTRSSPRDRRARAARSTSTSRSRPSSTRSGTSRSSSHWKSPANSPGLRGEHLGQGDVPDQRGQVDCRQGRRRGDQPDEDHLHAVAVEHLRGGVGPQGLGRDGVVPRRRVAPEGRMADGAARVGVANGTTRLWGQSRLGGGQGLAPNRRNSTGICSPCR